MARLRVTDIDAVEQQDDLVLGTASDGDVCLCTNGPSLTDIHAYSVFQEIVNTLYWCLRNVCAIQYSDHSRSLTLCQGRPRAGDCHLLEHHLAGCRGGGGVCHDGIRRDTLRRGVGQRGYGEHATYHLSSQTGKE